MRSEAEYMNLKPTINSVRLPFTDFPVDAIATDSKSLLYSTFSLYSPVPSHRYNFMCKSGRL